LVRTQRFWAGLGPAVISTAGVCCWLSESAGAAGLLFQDRDGILTGVSRAPFRPALSFEDT